MSRPPRGIFRETLLSPYATLALFVWLVYSLASLIAEPAPWPTWTP